MGLENIPSETKTLCYPSGNHDATNNDQSVRMKEMLSKVTSSNLIIDELLWNKREKVPESGHLLSQNDECYTGEVTFSVKLESLNLTAEECKHKYNKELFSNFMIDFIGELIVRTNISKFTDHMMSLNKKDYSDSCSSRTHAHFGVQLDDKKNKLYFLMHLSLVQSIATEEFRLSYSYG